MSYGKTKEKSADGKTVGADEHHALVEEGGGVSEALLGNEDVCDVELNLGKE